MLMPFELTLVKSTAERVLSHPTWDLILVFALLAGGFFYGISAGKRRIAATIIYTYVAFALYSALPLGRMLYNFKELDEFLIKSGFFLGIFLLLAFFLGTRRSKGFAPASSWWQIFLFSFLQVGLLIRLFLEHLPPGKISMLAPPTKNVFANPDFHLWWMALPIGVLIILRRFEAREN